MEQPSPITVGLDRKFVAPKWSGPHAVGVVDYDVADPTRDEQFSIDPGQKRRLNIRIFYPAKKGGSTSKLPLVSDFFLENIVSKLTLNQKRLRLENYQDVNWDIATDSQVSDEEASFPVIIFSHGYGGYQSKWADVSSDGYDTQFINSTIESKIGNIVSHGYIVVAIIHSYANLSVFKSGELIHGVDLPSDDVGAYLSTWSADQSFVLDHLESMQNEGSNTLYTKMSLATVGAFGHSYGGAAAFHSAIRDDRICAVINMDGTIFNFEDQVFKKPFAFFIPPAREDHQLFDSEQGFENFQADTYKVAFDGFTHRTFEDVILWWQWDHPSLDVGFGTVDAAKSVMLLSDSITQFFDKYLKAGSAPWLDDPDATPVEMSVTVVG